MTEPRYDPFDGRKKVSKDDFAIYLRRVGRGLNCRLDVPILNLEDLKWAAKTFIELGQELQDLAFKDDRVEVVRVLAARYAMEEAKRVLYAKNDRKEVIKRIVDERANPYKKRVMSRY